MIPKILPRHSDSGAVYHGAATRAQGALPSGLHTPTGSAPEPRCGWVFWACETLSAALVVAAVVWAVTR